MTLHILNQHISNAPMIKFFQIFGFFAQVDVHIVPSQNPLNPPLSPLSDLPPARSQHPLNPLCPPSVTYLLPGQVEREV